MTLRARCSTCRAVKPLPQLLPVEAILSIVEQAIAGIIDPEALKAAELAEQSERDIARRIAATSVERLLEAAS